MRVLHLVASPTSTGPADPALGLARAQRALGVDVAIAFDQRRPGNMTEKCREAGLDVEPTLALSTIRAVSTGIADARRLRRLSDRYDVIHAHTSHDHALAAAVRGRALVIRTIHHPRSAERRGLQGWVYRRSDGLLFVTEDHRRRLLESYPWFEPSRSSVVPGAVDVERFHPGVDGSAIRREQAIPGEALVLGMIARIKPGRRHDLLLDAFRRLADPRIYLAFIGKGEGHAALAARVAELHLEDRVRFYGFRDHDLPEAIRSLDVSILLAEGNDASCRAVLESMAAGVPVIGVAFPAIADAIDGSGGGISVPPDDEAALVRALSDLVGLAPGERAAMGARARERAVARHSDRTRAEAVLAFYERIRARRVY